ncbi:aminotransferase class V-fold PLP-dependent enzyme [Rubinisphaera margarita]|uniref:aminotransferase class V-fold PLP-dependent enzyme n=1 Tax=Rubinisphaera margarita TaxID=2909586 RepID=UPI001EE9AAA5|nr:aminotransferase class V-fold PLP-dependent enzyme [Rubinisphaera margarita]MCG6155988.1 aminotransferase class V-fold PLP-dependent enzyme [Rubinisphaera margarita]
MSNLLREAMAINDGVAYFDNAAVAPLTRAARETIVRWASDIAGSGDALWPRWRTEIEKTRRTAAALINAEREELALTHSTTEGINFVAEGYPWKAGDNVVIPVGEFPTNVFPWMLLKAQGVELRKVEMPSNEVDLERLADACDDRTRIVSCSWVGYSHGYRIDVKALADLVHQRGALLLLDAIQGLGVFPLDVKESDIDFLSADGHKWMLGPEGAGVFYLKREHLDLLRPRGIGWNSVATAGEFGQDCMDLRNTAGRYEGGTYNMCGLAGFGASLQVFTDIGVDQISRDLKTATDAVVAPLRDLGAIVHSVRDDDHWSGILSFDLPGKDPLMVKEAACKKDVYFNSRGGHIRVSPHAFNTPNDIDKLIEVLKDA